MIYNDNIYSSLYKRVYNKKYIFMKNKNIYSSLYTLLYNEE